MLNILCKTPDPLLKIKNELEFIRKDVGREYWNDSLAGAIEEQYNPILIMLVLDEDLVLNICEDTERLQTYITEYNEVYLESLWINFSNNNTHIGD